jgi:D-inositol-3-phosphate glycosyltransferase
VLDGVTGALVPPNDPQTLAEKVDELIRDDSVLHQYGQNALTHVNRHFTWKNVATQMEAVYNIVLRETAQSFTKASLKEDIAAA